MTAARLHHERISGGAAPTATLLLTHGMFGTGGNWRSIARAVLARRPDWSALLVDLRLHGRSEPGTPPHTVAACADDLAALIAQQASTGPPMRAVCGHSFGGKVVLALRAAGGAATVEVDVDQTWVLDASPSARPGGWDAPDNQVRAVWDSLVLLDRSWARRDDLVTALGERGHAPALAAWLAMNLAPVAGVVGLRLRFDLPALRALVLDYLAVDLWPAVVDPTLAGEVHVVVATRATTVGADDRARLAALPPSARVHTHLVDAGHWLHLDAPAAVVELLATQLPTR